MSRAAVGRRPWHSDRLPTVRSSALPRHLASGTASRGASRFGAARSALRARTAERRSAIILVLGVACALMLIAVPILLVLGGAPSGGGRTGDDGVFSDGTGRGAGGQGGQGGPGGGLPGLPTAAAGSPVPGDAAAGGGAADAGADLTGVGGDAALPGAEGSGPVVAGGAAAGGAVSGPGAGGTGSGSGGTTGGSGGSGGTGGGTGTPPGGGDDTTPPPGGGDGGETAPPPPEDDGGCGCPLEPVTDPLAEIVDDVTEPGVGVVPGTLPGGL